MPEMSHNHYVCSGCVVLWLHDHFGLIQTLLYGWMALPAYEIPLKCEQWLLSVTNREMMQYYKFLPSLCILNFKSPQKWFIHPSGSPLVSLSHVALGLFYGSLCISFKQRKHKNTFENGSLQTWNYMWFRSESHQVQVSSLSQVAFSLFHDSICIWKYVKNTKKTGKNVFSGLEIIYNFIPKTHRVRVSLLLHWPKVPSYFI